MFERCTEKARRAIFFGRYEASQLGSPYVETEHLLLGLLRDKQLVDRFLGSRAAVDSIRGQIEGRAIGGDKTAREEISARGDLPLSGECKRVLAYGAEEALRLDHRYIGAEHLLLGLLREEKCFAAEILHERGLRLSSIREELANLPRGNFPQAVEDGNEGRFRCGRLNFSPSETVHISPARDSTGTEMSTGPEHWAAFGFTLKALLMEVYRVQESLVDIDPGLDGDARYDVALVLPEPEDRGLIVGRIQRAIERELRLRVSREVRSRDIYVLTAPEGGAPPGRFGDHASGEPGMGAFSGSWNLEPSSADESMLAALRSGDPQAMLSFVRKIPAIGRGFAHMSGFLPFSFGLLRVEPADQEGNHSIEIDCMGPRSAEDLFRALWKDLGIVATEERRDVWLLMVRRGLNS